MVARTRGVNSQQCEIELKSAANIYHIFLSMLQVVVPSLITGTSVSAFMMEAYRDLVGCSYPFHPFLSINSHCAPTPCIGTFFHINSKYFRIVMRVRNLFHMKYF